jgi:hypothetical protein
MTAFRSNMSSILTIGISADVVSGCASASFLSRRHFSEFDLIIWDLNSLYKEAADFIQKSGGNIDGRLHESTIVPFREFLKERLDELIKYLNLGRHLIIIPHALPMISYFDNYQNSKRMDLGSYGLLDAESVLGRHGDRAEWAGSEEIAQLLPELSGPLAYSAILTDKASVIPLWKVSGTQDIIGGVFLTRGGGFIIYAPHPHAWYTNGGLAEKRKYVQGLIKLPTLLCQSINRKTDQPAWASLYQLPKENLALNQIEVLSTHITEMQTRILQHEKEISEEQEWKNLFTAYDNILVDAVLAALKILKIPAVKGPKNHADIIAAYNGDVVALEVKGKTGSAARANAQQCLTWVSEVASALVSEEGQRKNDTVIREYLRCMGELGVQPCDSKDETLIEISHCKTVQNQISRLQCIGQSQRVGCVH